MANATDVQIPPDSKPADGRFGCGPSKVRPEQLEHLAAHGGSVMGTSHRQKPVKEVVGRVRGRPGRAVLGARRLRGRPGQRRHHRVLGRGRLRPRARARADLVFGEFSSKFASVTKGAPFLGDPIVVSADPRHRPGGARERRPERRRHRLGAQRDLDRRDAARHPAWR